MSENCVYWKATMGLRVKRIRYYWDMDFGGGLINRQYHPVLKEVVQQAWLSDKGEIEWRDLEVFETQENMYPTSPSFSTPDEGTCSAPAS